MQLIYYNNLDNKVSFDVKRTFSAFDLSGFTRFTAEFVGTDTTNNFTLDTDVTTGSIVANSNGVVTIDPSSASPAEDNYTVKLIAYNSTFINGITIADPCCGNALCIRVCGSFQASKIYAEVELNQSAGDEEQDIVVGITQSTPGPDPNTLVFTGIYGFYFRDYGDNITPLINGVSQTPISGFDFVRNDIVQIAVSGTDLWIGKNNTEWAGGGDPATGTTPTITGIPSGNWYLYVKEEREEGGG